MIANLIILDDFYADAHMVRQQALNLDYPDRRGEQNFPGRNSRQKLQPPGLENLISEITGERLAPSGQNAHGHCRAAMAGDDERRRYYVHIDPGVVWSGILYLTLPEHCRGGTEFYRHIETDSDRAPLFPDELRTAGAQTYWEAGDRIVQRDSNDLSKWELTMTVPMRFNRLILLRPWLWHTAGISFGDSLENCRLVHLFFFEGVPTGT